MGADRTEYRVSPWGVERAGRRGALYHRRPRHRDGPGARLHRRPLPLYVAAAGGGVWRTSKALHTNPSQKWEYISGSFGTNAIGSLLLDPNDPTGNTLYAATGEENASGDSEAGVGIYKTTDGGDKWKLVPGSDVFFQRSIGRMALDNAGNLLVPIGSGVRGISSVSGGSLSSGSTDHPLAIAGLWRQSGATFSLIWPSPLPCAAPRPSRSIRRTRGHLRQRVPAGHLAVDEQWRHVLADLHAQDPTVAASATDRSEFAVTTLRNGATRMYVGEGQGGGTGITRTSGAATTLTPRRPLRPSAERRSTTTARGNAGRQHGLHACRLSRHRLPARLLQLRSARRRFERPRGAPLDRCRNDWSDLTQDGDPTHAEFTHPGSARHRDFAWQSVPLLGRLGRRHHQLGRTFRERRRQV